MSSRRRKGNPKPQASREEADSSSQTSNAAMPSIKELLRRQPLWMLLAVASGACAAFNGVFAKLTTTALTSSLASHIASSLSLDPSNTIVEVAVRGFFFLMNLLFNAAMWALFTAALTRSDSTTRVSIINVSANFMITAILGWMIFSEKLPPLWWLGASLLAGGNVVIGAREQAEKPGGTIGLDETREEAEALLEDPREVEADDLIELDKSTPEQQRLRHGEDSDAPI